MAEKRILALNVNGDRYEIACTPNTTLLEALREKALLTGTKRGCDVGACGACTVLMDGRAILACLTLAADAEGREIRTVEGLSEGGTLSPLQQTFVDHGALQCGFCSPGFLVSATELLAENPSPTRAEIQRQLAGNLCRCTGYVKIVEAVEITAAKLAGGAQ
jgi:carbon-monoxide dehydrogenase small subunit